MPIGALLCLVVSVSDGDTLTARCGDPGQFYQVKVRVSAIDAPEKAQPFGQRSRQALADLCFQQPAAITPRGRDRYGRTVADVECRGQDAGQAQVRAGMAWVFDRYARGYESLYRLQAGAREARAGLWTDAEPVPPWDWRKETKKAAM